ncbi:8-oxo-dGTP diphosphatase MutT [Aliagarivorans marinus]|uniref:8-oxo-dGTP diphosphatase MutT n=1 Tax=Aliagarivorans marinus TaxID=561965 RepID=UPI0003FA634F|nr:8-oxo-dGTP diphosphatase MutT [Aliagarivorans marinus]
MKTVNVAVGVIVQQQQILLSKRHASQHQGGLWEFPGGKIEPNETVLEAMQRELHEELGIDIDAGQASHLIDISHDYGDKQVCLQVYVIPAFTGKPEGREGQPLRWVAKAELLTLAFPEANQTIVELLQEAL